MLCPQEVPGVVGWPPGAAQLPLHLRASTELRSVPWPDRGRWFDPDKEPVLANESGALLLCKFRN